jgi:HEAT repeat protein
MNTLNCIDPTPAVRRGAFAQTVRALSAALLLSALGMVSAGALEVKGGDGNVSLSNITGTPTLVTVVLKGGAKDPNLQVVEVVGETISFTSERGDRVNYQSGDIDHLAIQGSVVARVAPVVTSNVALRPEDQRIVDQGTTRVAELFQNSKDNQDLRIRAAAYMAADGNKEAEQYLISLAESNNLQARIDAARGLYLAGKPLPGTVIKDGLESNNRNIRAAAAVLAGLFKDESATPELMTMLNDRSAQFAAPAGVALARLGNREIIPQLFSMLGSNSDEKNHAGVEGLIILGGADLIETAKYRIKEVDGLERYRLTYVLFRLGDEVGRKEAIRVFNEELTIKPEAALVLAADKYWEATQYLQERLKRREDATAENMSYRARNASAIMAGGDPSAVYVFQELLRSESVDSKIQVLRLIGDSGDRSLLKLMTAAIDNTDTNVSIEAANAALAVANPGFRQRLKDLRLQP